MCNIDLENLLNAIGISDDYSQKIINEYNLWFAEENVFEFLPDEEWYLKFIFNLEYFQWKDGLDIHSLTEETSLQRGVKQLLLEGKKIGAALGYLHTS